MWAEADSANIAATKSRAFGVDDTQAIGAAMNVTHRFTMLHMHAVNAAAGVEVRLHPWSANAHQPPLAAQLALIPLVVND